MKIDTLPPIHPGEILREEFMKPRGLSKNGLARALNVPPRRINEIVLEKRAIARQRPCAGEHRQKLSKTSLLTPSTKSSRMGRQ